MALVSSQPNHVGYLRRDGVPLEETALAMKRLSVKLEQEALLDGRDPHGR